MLFTNLFWASVLTFSFTSATPLQPRGWGDWQSDVNNDKTTTKTGALAGSSTANTPSVIKSTSFPIYHNATNSTSSRRPARPHGTSQIGGWWGSPVNSPADSSSGDSSDGSPAGYGSGGGSDNTPTVYVPSAGSADIIVNSQPIANPIVTMTPSIPPGHDTSDRQNLKVSYDQGLFFAEGNANSYASPGSMYLSANTKFNHPSVVLDHSDHASATITGNSISVNFADGEAYNIAVSSWPKDGSDFIIITNVASADGHYVYYQVSSAQFDEKTLSATGTFATPDFNDLFESFDLSWGKLSNSSDDAASSSSFNAVPVFDQINSTYGTNWTAEDVAELNSIIGDPNDYLIWDEAHFKDSLHEFAPGLEDDDWDDYQEAHADDAGIYGDDGELDTDSEANAAMENTIVARASSKCGSRKCPKGKVQPSKQATSLSNIKQDSAQKTKKNPPKKSFFGKLWKSVVKPVINTVKKVISFVDGTPHPFSKTASWQYPDAKSKGLKLEDSDYWTNSKTGQKRKQFQILKETKKAQTSGDKDKNVKVYCVDCEIKASATVGGVAAFHITKGITRAEVFLDADFTAGLHIGVAAEYELEKSTTKQLFTAGLPGFSIPNIITVGPMVTVDARAVAKVGGQGTLLVGGSMAMKGIKAVLDLQDSSKNVSPKLKPEFVPVFEANAEATASLTLTLPISIAVGINVARGKFRADAGITAEPGVALSAEFKASAELVDGKITTSVGSKTCQGVEVGLKVQNKFYAQAQLKLLNKGKKTEPKDLGAPWEYLVGTRCIGKKPTAPSKRQFGNNTLAMTNSSDYTYDSTFGGKVFTLVQYPGNGTDLPFEDILTGFYTDEDDDGINDIDEFWWPPEVAAYLDDDHPEYYTLVLNTTKREETPATSPTQTSASGELNEAALEQALAAAVPAVDTVYNYTMLFDSTLTLTLVAEPNGYVGVQEKSDQVKSIALWQEYDGVIVGDSQGRVFCHYPELLEKRSYSPLFLAKADQIPHKTQLTNLINMVYDESTQLGTAGNLVSNIPPAVFMATRSSKGDAYWPVVCNWEDTSKPSQVYLVTDLGTAINVLRASSVVSQLLKNQQKEIFPYGKIAGCQYLPLIDGEAGTKYVSDGK